MLKNTQKIRKTYLYKTNLKLFNDIDYLFQKHIQLCHIGCGVEGCSNRRTQFTQHSYAQPTFNCTYVGLKL